MKRRSPDLQERANHIFKKQLYGMGAAYAQMSGSGSAFFGIFFDKPQTQVEECFPDCFTFTAQL